MGVIALPVIHSRDIVRVIEQINAAAFAAGSVGTACERRVSSVDHVLGRWSTSIELLDALSGVAVVALFEEGSVVLVRRKGGEMGGLRRLSGRPLSTSIITQIKPIIDWRSSVLLGAETGTNAAWNGHGRAFHFKTLRRVSPFIHG